MIAGQSKVHILSARLLGADGAWYNDAGEEPRGRGKNRDGPTYEIQELHRSWEDLLAGREADGVGGVPLQRRLAFDLCSSGTETEGTRRKAKIDK